MSLKIEITVPEDTVAVGGAEEYLANALSAIGFAKRKTSPNLTSGARESLSAGSEEADAKPLLEAVDDPAKYAAAAIPPLEPTKPARRGRPPKAKPEPAPKPAAEAPQISTGEERVGPEDDIEEIDEETAAQDKVDEVAEAEAKADPSRPLTHDDIRNLLGEYVRVYGMPAAQSDGPVVIGELWPGKSKISDIPADQDELRRAIDAFEAMMSSNRFGRKAVA